MNFYEIVPYFTVISSILDEVTFHPLDRGIMVLETLLSYMSTFKQMYLQFNKKNSVVFLQSTLEHMHMCRMRQKNRSSNANILNDDTVNNAYTNTECMNESNGFQRYEKTLCIYSSKSIKMSSS